MVETSGLTMEQARWIEQLFYSHDVRNCITLRYNFYQDTRQMKLLDSRQIRQVRGVCIFEINGISVFL